LFSTAIAVLPKSGVNWTVFWQIRRKNGLFSQICCSSL
jgi:hypothetical protein